MGEKTTSSSGVGQKGGMDRRTLVLLAGLMDAAADEIVCWVTWRMQGMVSAVVGLEQFTADTTVFQLVCWTDLVFWGKLKAVPEWAIRPWAMGSAW